jgi:hypothetical protein
MIGWDAAIGYVKREEYEARQFIVFAAAGQSSPAACALLREP